MTSKVLSLFKTCPFGITFQQGAQLIAALNIFCGVLLVIITPIVLISLDDIYVENRIPTGSIFLMGAIFWIVFLLYIGFYYVLLKGATEKSAKKVKIFLIIDVVITVIEVLIVLIAAESFGMSLAWLIGHSFIFYEIWIVFCFHKELGAPVDQNSDQASNYDHC